MRASKEKEDKLAVDFQNSGKSIKEICEINNCTDKVLYRIIKQRNLVRKILYKQPAWMKGSSIEKHWIQKYGMEESNRRMVIYREKHRINNIGSKNAMYGKPSPQGSGNGWKGWYRGIFFRSLRELSFMIRMDEEEKNFITAENISIPYEFNGVQRTYRPDYIVENKYMVEIKPTRLHKTPNVEAKQKAAIEYCKNNNLEYLLIDEPIHFTACVDFAVEWMNEKYYSKIVKWIYKDKPTDENTSNFIKYIHKNINFDW